MILDRQSEGKRLKKDLQAKKNPKKHDFKNAIVTAEEEEEKKSMATTATEKVDEVGYVWFILFFVNTSLSSMRVTCSATAVCTWLPRHRVGFLIFFEGHCE